MTSIMVINAKGGSGKTTISTNLAAYYANADFNVTLVDLDPQNSSLNWLKSVSHVRQSSIKNHIHRIV